MSTAQAAPAAEPAAGPTGFFANLIDLYFSPAEGFGRVLRKPAFYVPLALHIAIGLAFTAVWVQKADFKAFMKARIEESPRASQIPPERMEEIVNRQAQMMPVMAWGGGVLGPPIAAFVLGGIFLFVFRF